MEAEFNRGLKRGILLMGSASLAYMLGAHFRRLKEDRIFVKKCKQICEDAHFEGFLDGYSKGVENGQRDRSAGITGITRTGAAGSAGSGIGSTETETPKSDFDRAASGGIGNEIRAKVGEIELPKARAMGRRNSTSSVAKKERRPNK